MDCHAPVEKFRDDIFKSGATHGKDHVFRSLGYDRDDSQYLASLYEQQAAVRYIAGDYVLGHHDEHGQRINIEIALEGVGTSSARTGYLVSGWMIQGDGSIRLNTPFSGFSRDKQS
jgi:hypothetical protein